METYKKCIVCDKLFLGKGNKMTCSPDCQDKRNRQMHKVQQEKYDNKSVEKICNKCGQIYMGKIKSMYCSDACKSKKESRTCLVCNKKFLCFPSDNNTTCSSKCSRERRAEIISKRGLSGNAKEKISVVAKKKGYTENLKMGTPAAQKSPKAGRFETNVNAKNWVLKSPEGKIYQCRNLNLWAIKHCELFGFVTNEHSARKIASGIRHAKRGAKGKKNARTCTYKGWMVILSNDTVDIT